MLSTAYLRVATVASIVPLCLLLTACSGDTPTDQSGEDTAENSDDLRDPDSQAELIESDGEEDENPTDAVVTDSTDSTDQAQSDPDSEPDTAENDADGAGDTGETDTSLGDHALDTNGDSERLDSADSEVVDLVEGDSTDSEVADLVDADVDLADSADPDSEVGSLEPIRLLVYDDDGLPAQASPVVFTDPAGAFLVELSTDEAGRVEHILSKSEPVTVTTLSILDDTRFLTTFVDVEPGADLIVGWPEFEEEDAAGTLTVDMPDPIDDADRYILATPGAVLSSAPYFGSRTVSIYDDRLREGDLLDVLAYVRGAGPENELLGAAGEGDITLNRGGTTTIDLGDWVTDLTDLSVTLTNVPAGSSNASNMIRGHLGSVSLFFDWGRLQQRNPEAGSTVSTTVAVPDGVFDLLVSSTRNLTEAEGRDPVSELFAANEPTTPIAVDLSADLLTPPANPTVTTDGQIRLNWEDTGEAIDAISFESSWSSDAGETVWLVIMPPDTSPPFDLPELSDRLGELPPADSTLGAPGVTYFESSQASTYGEFLDLFGSRWGLSLVELSAGVRFRRAGSGIGF